MSDSSYRSTLRSPGTRDTYAAEVATHESGLGASNSLRPGVEV